MPVQITDPTIKMSGVAVAGLELAPAGSCWLVCGSDGLLYASENGGAYTPIGASGETDIVIADNTLNAFQVRQAANEYIGISTFNGAELVRLGASVELNGFGPAFESLGYVQVGDLYNDALNHGEGTLKARLSYQTVIPANGTTLVNNDNVLSLTINYLANGASIDPTKQAIGLQLESYYDYSVDASQPVSEWHIKFRSPNTVAVPWEGFALSGVAQWNAAGEARFISGFAGTVWFQDVGRTLIHTSFESGTISTSGVVQNSTTAGTLALFGCKKHDGSGYFYPLQRDADSSIKVTVNPVASPDGDHRVGTEWVLKGLAGAGLAPVEVLKLTAGGGPGAYVIVGGYDISSGTYIRADDQGDGVVIDIATGGNAFKAHYAGGALRIGLFGAAPVAKPTVNGSRANPEQALANLLAAAASLGLITNSTTA